MSISMGILNKMVNMDPSALALIPLKAPLLVPGFSLQYSPAHVYGSLMNDVTNASMKPTIRNTTSAAHLTELPKNFCPVAKHTLGKKNMDCAMHCKLPVAIHKALAVGPANENIHVCDTVCGTKGAKGRQ